MQVLLIDSNESSASYWQCRLTELGFDSRWLPNLANGSDQKKLTRDCERASLFAAICRIDAGHQDGTLRHTTDLLSSVATRVFAFAVDSLGDHVIEADCYSAGFDDLITDEISDQQLTRKLKNAMELYRLKEQFRKVQKLESINILAAGITHEINTSMKNVGDNTRFVHDAYADILTIFDASETLLTTLDSHAQKTPPQIKAAAESLRSSIDNAEIRVRGQRDSTSDRPISLKR